MTILKTSALIVLLNIPIQSFKIKTDLSYLKYANRKYPNEIKLLNDQKLSMRLKALLKNRLVFLKKTWAVETPIEVANEHLTAWGCQQHNCDQTNFIIVVDFKKNVVYCGIRENENVKVYSEDESVNSEITKWSKRN